MTQANELAVIDTSKKCNELVAASRTLSERGPFLPSDFRDSELVTITVPAKTLRDLRAAIAKAEGRDA